ncbi:putative arabinose efflux permease, MFS family [Dehalogenimonas formicexedens]|uniref:Putative arabinose efflux permease, MFS family n=1 Tax=Dehalogenimonas formicexedens TaxID=1839801 RepID=A0A1P8F7F1_9CHLR|nr:MFS transporter [Dehalogenimonas formicexedens]APV44401.1 putative arabinose efflux permease, MFS family [Dehalogenimonas formicexedens]
MKSFTTNPTVNKSLRLSVFDGAAFNAMMGLTQDFMSPFALALKASTAQIGLLASLPNLALALSQLGSPWISERLRSRKSLLVPMVITQAVLWLPIFIMPQLFHNMAVWWLIALFTAGSVFGALGNPAWGSMMADLVPAGMRGRYFGFRNRIGGATLLACFFLGGLVLQASSNQIMLGFGLLFGAAVIFRLASAYFLSKMYEPPMRRCNDPWHPFHELKTLPATPVGRLSLFVGAMMLATYVASPFFAVYMLNDLGFGYGAFVVVTASASVANFLFMGFWGRRADRSGHLQIVRVTALMIPLVPVLWLAGHNIIYLIVIQVFSGFAWSGFNLSGTNLLYEAAAPERRTRAIAVFNALSGTAMCIGAAVGGLIATRLPEISGQSLLTLFLISGILRGAVTVFILPSLGRSKRVDRMPILSQAPSSLALRVLRAFQRFID